MVAILTRLRRLYADTSVFGGCLDEEFAEASQQLFALIAQGHFRLVVSDTTLLELQGAPEEVRAVLLSLPREAVEWVPVTEEVDALRDAYLAAGIVGPASRRDAEHIAAASVADMDLIVSWNFKHIVHYDKIGGYHGVNLLRGYRPIPIHSPLEVI